jgi:serine/threonine protein kinase
MSLHPGARIGAYEILSPLGAGGMGEVYRARDTKLNRDVAIKVLLAEVAGDPERLARFQREAQLLASLNHPHIGAIYGVEDAHPAGSGQAHSSSGATLALVMELVDGPTLADRLARARCRSTRR